MPSSLYHTPIASGGGAAANAAMVVGAGSSAPDADAHETWVEVEHLSQVHARQALQAAKLAVQLSLSPPSSYLVLGRLVRTSGDCLTAPPPNCRACTQGLCARTRPHFFRGVCTVVTKLFHIVEPGEQMRAHPWLVARLCGAC